MTRPTLKVADILRVQANRFLDRYRLIFGFQQLKAFRAIPRCRTAALGGHRDACLRCGYQAISYNSGRNRHCPKCQAQARKRWLEARERELLDTSYFHVVFTVPHELNVLALENPRLFYELLFTASAETLLEIASDPKHLGAEIAVINATPPCVAIALSGSGITPASSKPPRDKTILSRSLPLSIVGSGEQNPVSRLPTNNCLRSLSCFRIVFRFAALPCFSVMSMAVARSLSRPQMAF